MRNREKGIWYRFGGWFLLLGILVVIVAACFVAKQKNLSALPRTEAVPPAENEVTFDLDTNRAYTSEDGVVVIPATEQPGKSQTKPVEHLSDAGEVTALSTENYTLPEETMLEDGSIGVLSIPTLGLSAPVYETEAGGEMESMTKGIAHFAVSSAWDGNICLCSHNVAPAGAVAYFRDIHRLEKGDALSYKTALGEREYKVTEVKEIAEDDWTSLSRTEDNRLTLITCITGKPASRLMVQAIEG